MFRFVITFILAVGIMVRLTLGTPHTTMNNFNAIECDLKQSVIEKCIENLPENEPIEFRQIRKMLDELGSSYELDSLLDLCSGSDKEDISPLEIVKCTAHSCFVRSWVFHHFCQLVMESPIN
jgi:hypothetical protein